MKIILIQISGEFELTNQRQITVKIRSIKSRGNWILFEVQGSCA